MESATITTRTLKIDGMSGEVCVQEVKNAIKSVHGVSAQSVSVGAATIGADQAGCDAACAAISSAGYEAHEGASTGGANGSGRATPTPSSGPKGSNQSHTPAYRPGSDNSHATSSGGGKGAERPSANAPAKPAGVKH